MPGPRIGTGRRRRVISGPPSLNALSLSVAVIAENAAPGTLVGALQGRTSGSTLSLVSDAGGRFALSGANIVTGLVATNFEAATSHTITVRETLAGATGSPRDTILTINVTNVLEVTLAPLSLSASSVAENTGAGVVVGAVQNTAAGSTLSLVSDAGGRFALSGNNVVTGGVATDYETATSHSITLRETHPDAGNSPRDTAITINVTDVNEGPAPRVAQVASRSAVPMSLHATATKAMSRTQHTTRAAVTRLKIGLPNWYVNTGGNGEAGSGGTATFTASIEYPAGTYTQVTFSGSVSGVTANNTTLISDWVNISIPANTDFFVNNYGVFAGNVPHTFKFEAALGDKGIVGTTVTDSTMATFANSSSVVVPPVLILSENTLASVLIIGDSRAYGTGATAGLNSSNKGEIVPSILASKPFCNAGRFGINISAAVLVGTRRKELAAYFSDVIIQGGINDIAGGDTETTLRNNIIAIRNGIVAINATARVWLTTKGPETPTSTPWATAAQTPFAQEAVRVAHNAWVRSNPSGFAGYFEIADQIENGRDSGIWKFDGTPSKWTADGVHATTFGYDQIAASGAVNPAVFTYP